MKVRIRRTTKAAESDACRGAARKVQRIKSAPAGLSITSARSRAHAGFFQIKLNLRGICAGKYLQQNAISAIAESAVDFDSDSDRRSLRWQKS
jgi:hypothetical protein